MTTSAAAAALALHYGEPSPFLELRLPVNPLIDERHCHEISEALKEAGQDWECRRATPTLWKQLPTKPGLYMFIWRPPIGFRLAAEPDRPIVPTYVLYIGQAGAKSTNTLRARYKNEYANYVGTNPEILWQPENENNRKARLERYLTLVPLEYWWSVVDNPDHLLRLEARLNHLMSPPLGRMGRARLIDRGDAFPMPPSRSK